MPQPFDDDRDWLEHLPGMTPWDDACRRLAEQIDAWIATHVLPVWDGTSITADQHGFLQRRFWRCWSHCWRTGAATLPSPDLLTDVALAAALLYGQSRAVAALSARFRTFIIRYARRHDCDDSWNDFLVYLCVTGERSLGNDTDASPARAPVLERYDGRRPLAPWLKIVAFRFAIDRARGDAPKTTLRPDEAASADDPLASQIRRECLELLSLALDGFLTGLKRRDRSLLRLSLHRRCDNGRALKGRDMGRAFSLSDSSVSRVKKEVVNAMQLYLQDPANLPADRRRAYDECYGGDGPGIRDVADRLGPALESFGEEGES